MNRKGIIFLLITCIFLETLCYTYLLQTGLYYTISVVYFVAGLGICFLPLLLSVTMRGSDVNSKYNISVILIFGTIVTGLMLLSLPVQFKRVPIEYHIADMLPRIKIYATRFLAGQYVYDDVKEIWSGNLPPYLPATWAPFIPSVIWSFDMRWIPVAVFLTAVFGMLMIIKQSTDYYRSLNAALLLISLFFLFNYHTWHETEFWTMSYEGLIAAYYLILCLAIISWNPYLIGLAVSFCLLSRFALSFWVPVFIFFLWWKESFQFAVKVSCTIATLVLGLFILPFVVGHIDVFLKTINQYQRISEGFWKTNGIDEGLYNEVGLYKFFRSNQISTLRHIQLITTLAAPVIFIVITPKSLLNYKEGKILAGLCSLKITLLFFFNFIEMPFHYIFITPTIISYAIGFYYLSLESVSAADLVTEK